MARMSAEEFAAQLTQALGNRLVSLLLYGSAARDGNTAATMNTLLIVTDADSLFDQISAPVRAWMTAGQPPPLIMTATEWRTSADAFPIEYEDIRAAHRLLAGQDPWQGIVVRREHVRRQLEHELMGKLMHLRQAYAAEWHSPKRRAEIVKDTRAGFRTMLRAVQRLVGRTPATQDEVLEREAAALIGFAAADLTDPADYLAAVTRTAEFVNRMERTLS